MAPAKGSVGYELSPSVIRSIGDKVNNVFTTFYFVSPLDIIN